MIYIKLNNGLIKKLYSVLHANINFNVRYYLYFINKTTKIYLDDKYKIIYRMQLPNDYKIKHFVKLTSKLTKA